MCIMYVHYFNALIKTFYIIVPLLLSKTASFEFNDLKDACVCLRHEDNCSIFFIEILHKILSSKETQDIKEVSIGVYFLNLIQISLIRFLYKM